MFYMTRAHFGSKVLRIFDKLTSELDGGEKQSNSGGNDLKTFKLGAEKNS